MTNPAQKFKSRFGHWSPKYITDRLVSLKDELFHPDWPWLNKQAVLTLNEILKPGYIGLEFGSGRSTAWIARRVGHLTSIEHDRDWFEKTKKSLLEKNIRNAEIFLKSKNDYLDVLEEARDASLDFILIDGILRDECVRASVPKLKPGGILVIDNINWFIDNKTPSLPPKNRGYVKSNIWKQFFEETAGWREIPTSNGITRTLILFKPKKNILPETKNTSKKKSRVAIFLTYPIHYKIDLYKELASRPDLEVMVYFGSNLGIKPAMDRTFGKITAWYEENGLSGLPHKFLKNYSFNRSAMPADNPLQGTANFGIVRELFRNRYDAIFMDGYMMITHWLILIFAPLAGTSVILRGESNLSNYRPRLVSAAKDFLLPLVFKRVAAFLYIGKLNKEYYKRYRVPEKKLFFAPYTVNNRFFQDKIKTLPSKKQLKKEAGMGADNIVILYASKLIERKRPLDLLEAYERLTEVQKRKVQLIFAGDGPELEHLKNRIRENSVKNVRLLGFQNQGEMARLYALSDIFVLPSSFETWGLVINEAMNFSLPIVTTDMVGSSRDLIKNGYNGFVYKAGDTDALANNILRLIEDKKSRQKMGVKSLETIKRWSYEETAAGMIKAMNCACCSQVIVANPGSHHLYQTAIGLEKENLLGRYITSIYYKPDAFPYSLIKLLPEKVRNKISSELGKRHYPELDDSKIKTFGFYEWLRILNDRITKFEMINKFIIGWRNQKFSLKAGRLAKNSKVLWAAMDGALEAFEMVKSGRTIRVLDEFIGHPASFNNVLKEEIGLHPELKNVCKEILTDDKLKRLIKEIELADKIVVGSQFAKETLRSNGVPDDKVEIIPYGADTNVFYPGEKRKSDIFKILFVGNISVRKGCHYLLEAIKEINDPNVRLAMIGTMEDKYFWERYGKCFTWVPHIPHSQMPYYFREADILMLPSLFEGSALVIYEALASGLPVITTKNSGSVVRDGKNGFVIPIRNSNAIKEKILLLRKDEKLLNSMRKNARKQAENYTWRIYRERVSKLIRNLTSANQQK